MRNLRCYRTDRNFYPRPPRGGRPQAEGAGGTRPTISIHALREEGDGSVWHKYTMAKKFLSTPSARRATGRGDPRHPVKAISIHALREEGDFFTPF